MNKEKALSELLAYCVQYKTPIFNALANDPSLQMEHMHLKFEAIAYANMASQQQQQQQNGVNASLPSQVLAGNVAAAAAAANTPLSNVFGHPAASSGGLAHV